jgi:hypothetical protein
MKALRWKSGALFFEIDRNPARALWTFPKYRFSENAPLKAEGRIKKEEGALTVLMFDLRAQAPGSKLPATFDYGVTGDV